MIGLVVLLIGGIFGGVLISSEDREINQLKKEYNTQFGYYEVGKPETFVPLYKNNYEDGDID